MIALYDHIQELRAELKGCQFTRRQRAAVQASSKMPFPNKPNTTGPWIRHSTFSLNYPRLICRCDRLKAPGRRRLQARLNRFRISARGPNSTKTDALIIAKKSTPSQSNAKIGRYNVSGWTIGRL